MSNVTDTGNFPLGVVFYRNLRFGFHIKFQRSFGFQRASEFFDFIVNLVGFLLS